MAMHAAMMDLLLLLLDGPNIQAAIILGVLLPILILYFRYQWTRKRDFPSPFPFPFNQTALSDLAYLAFTVIVFHKRQGSAFFRSLRKKYGDVLECGALFASPESCRAIMVFHPEDQLAIMRKDKALEIVVNMPPNIKAIHGDKNFQNLSIGKRHSSLRKIFASLLSPRSLETFTKFMLEEFHALWENLEKGGKEVRIQDKIRDAQLKLMCKLLYGLTEETEQEREILDQFTEDFELTDKALTAMDMNSSTFKEGLEAKNRIFKVLAARFDEVFEKRMAKKQQEQQQHPNSSSKADEYKEGSAMEQIADALVEMGCTGKKSGNAEMDEAYDDARENLYLLLEASHGTTMTITSAAIFLLNKKENMRYLQRLREDVQSFEPTYENLKKYEFAQACVNEAMRLAPFAGGVGYYVKEGKSFTLRGKTIHGPIVVQLNSSNWYRDNEVFPKADDFAPERWMAGDPFEASKFAKSTFRPFGFGRHICLGYPLAKLVMAANLYCFASNDNRRVLFDEDEVVFEEKFIPERGIKDRFPGRVDARN